MSLTMGPAPRSGPGKRPNATRPEKSGGRNAIRGTEANAARALLSAVMPFDFDAGAFAVILAGAPVAIQKRIVRLLFAYFCVLGSRLEQNLWMDDEEYSFLISGARARDSLIPFMEDEGI